jgi:peptidoglycan/LPS O-acetylase OafA/YrhL
VLIQTIPKYHGLEILRFAMSLVVILWHISSWIGPLKPSLLNAVVGSCQPLAVPIFWCLSGFIFHAVYEERIHSKSVGLRAFAIARFSRLYPLAFATLLLCLTMNEIYFRYNKNSFVYHRGDLYHFLLNVLLVSHWGLQKFTAFNGPVWSISVELITYFAFFGIARFWGKSLLISIFVILLGKIVSHFEPNLTHHLAISSCIQQFFLGGLFHKIIPHIRNLFHKIIPHVRNSPNTQLSLVLTVSTGCLVMVSYLLPERYSSQLVPPLLVLSTALLGRSLSGWIQRAADFVGSLTYSSYLLHFPLILLAVIGCDIVGIPRSILCSSVGIFVIVATIFVISRLTFVYFEIPMQFFLRTRLSERASLQMPNVKRNEIR